MVHSLAQRVRQYRWYAGGAALLLLLLAGTWATQKAWEQRGLEASEAWRSGAAREAVNYAASRYEYVQARLLNRAEALAESPEVVRGLRAVSDGEPAEGLVQAVAGRALPVRTAAEVYDATPRLVAWNGFSMPLGTAPDAIRFLDAPQAEFVRNGSRVALAVWWPVRDGTRAVGAVRLTQLVAVRYPVSNQYLRDYHLEEAWQWSTGMNLTLHPDATAPVDTAVVWKALRGPGGEPVGYASVPLPSAEALMQEGASRYDDVRAFWVTLLLVWGMAGAWSLYLLRMPPRSGEGTRRVGLRRTVHFGLVAAAWWGLRYALIALEVPARWQMLRGPLEPLFDPAHLASSAGGGLMQSTGDLLLTGVWALLFGVACFDAVMRYYGGRSFVRRWEWGRAGSSDGAGRDSAERRLGPAGGWGRAGLAVAVATVAGTGLVYLVAQAARRAVLDSTLDYFARTGLFPDTLVLVVFCGLVLLTLAVLFVTVSIVWVTAEQVDRWWPAWRTGWAGPLGGGVVAVLTLGLLYATTPLGTTVRWPVVAGFLAVSGGVVMLGAYHPRIGWRALTLQRLMPAMLIVTALLYPLLYGGMNQQRHDRILDAASSFSEGRDPRVLFAIRQMMEEMTGSLPLQELLADTSAAGPRFEALAVQRLRGTLLGSIGAYRVQMALYETGGAVRARYVMSGGAPGLGGEDEIDLLRAMYRERGAGGVMVEQMTGRLERERFQYVGLVPVERGGTEAGWLVVRAEPQVLMPEAGTPFPRVLLPAGSDAELYGALALAEFRDGVLVRSLGRDFGRYRLPDEVQQALRVRPNLWWQQEGRGQETLTYYQRHFARETSPVGVGPASSSTVAVRVQAITTSDHLYYLLRITLAGVAWVLPLYLLGLAGRWRQGVLPAPRVRFRDKVINAFFVVGAVSVIAMGMVGIGVIRQEGERAMQSQLRRQLEQVETTLTAQAQAGQPPTSVLRQFGLDSLAARVGVDLNLYEGARLVASSRPQLVREQLVDERLPASVYQALYVDGFHFVMNPETIGDFSYLAGYKALTDEQGRPRYVLSVPTLPEQERIAEEQARTVAYLFGALLLLVLIVMLTAALLAGALTRPLARLRAGLQAVGKGEFAEPLPVSTRDEIGDLVETFNEMRAQLSESRRKLAQQERELAWREMARQVAHEIKNPLTPMKLSVQHLQRAYDRLEPVPQSPNEAEEGRFRQLFDRITGTLVEQIDALVRIANEFSTFARLPRRVLDLLDLNEVVGAAVSLMQEEEAGVEIVSDLYAEPLVVEGDQEELRRIYINLIKNAIQAMPEGQAGRIEVTTRADVSGNGEVRWVQSTVRDNGMGIPPELHAKIFQPNFSTKNSGTGLGLAIVKKSIEEMQGAIWFETEEGEGTTFWLRLPRVETRSEGAGRDGAGGASRHAAGDGTASSNLP